MSNGFTRIVPNGRMIGFGAEATYLLETTVDSSIHTWRLSRDAALELAESLLDWVDDDIDQEEAL